MCNIGEKWLSLIAESTAHPHDMMLRLKLRMLYHSNDTLLARFACCYLDQCLFVSFETSFCAQCVLKT